MHETSMSYMRSFRAQLPQKGGRVLDVGSQDINGSYKAMWRGWKYIGLDIVPGANVDYIPEDPYSWDKLPDDSFDAVICGQTLEHIQYPELTFKEIFRVLKSGARCCVIAPSTGREHDQPWWQNISREHMQEMAEGVGLRIIQLFIGHDFSWHDCVLIAEKP